MEDIQKELGAMEGLNSRHGGARRAATLIDSKNSSTNWLAPVSSLWRLCGYPPASWVGTV